MELHPAWIEIDLSQFEKNLSAIRKMAPDRLICLPVKANAYGHGMVPMALAGEKRGVDLFGVASLSEGAALRRAGISKPILVFGAIHEGQIGELVRLGLQFSISSKYKAQLVADYCLANGLQASVHLEVDTGMNRTGMRPSTALSVYREISANRCFVVKGIYSHLATSDVPQDPFAMQQIEAFAKFKEQIQEPLLWHMANSGGVAFYPDSHFDMVRPGLLAYGHVPDGSKREGIAPLFSLKARLSFFKVVGKGQGISYGHIYRTKEETRVVTVPVGYGDGYVRALSNCASVLIRKKKYQISGRICMDQFMVDIGADEAYVGDIATLIGRDEEEEIGLMDLARLGNTDPREILCRFNDRLPRVYCE